MTNSLNSVSAAALAGAGSASALDVSDPLIYLHLFANLLVWGALVANLYFIGRGATREERTGSARPAPAVIVLTSTATLGTALCAYGFSAAWVAAACDRGMSSLLLASENAWLGVCAGAAAVGYLGVLAFGWLRQVELRDVWPCLVASEEGALLKRYACVLGAGAFYVIALPGGSLACNPAVIVALLFLGFLWANRLRSPACGRERGGRPLRRCSRSSARS